MYTGPQVESEKSELVSCMNIEKFSLKAKHCNFVRIVSIHKGVYYIYRVDLKFNKKMS